MLSHGVNESESLKLSNMEKLSLNRCERLTGFSVTEAI